MLVGMTRRWQCPGCEFIFEDELEDESTPAHTCPELRGLTFPMVRVPGKLIELPRNFTRVVAIERGDYENGENVQRDRDGRPVMAVHTERADGSHDTAVYAPSARVRSAANE